MTMEMNEASRRADIAPRYIQWSPVIAGALAATALSFILVTFAATVGLGVASSAPTWRDASAALWILSGLCTAVGLGIFYADAISAGITK